MRCTCFVTALPATYAYLRDCHTEEDRLRSVIRKEFPHRLPESEVALGTGMRKSEQYGLRWPDVDFKQKKVFVQRNKHGGERTVYLNATTLGVLEFLRSKTGDSEHVFSNNRGEMLRSNRWFEDALKKAGIEHFTWHCLRHTFGTRLVERGVDLRSVQDSLGHKTLSMTVRYTHPSEGRLRDAVARLDSRPTATATATETKGRNQKG